MSTDAIISIDKVSATFPVPTLVHIALTAAPDFLETSDPTENDPYTRAVWRRTPILFLHYLM